MPLLPSALPPKGEARHYVANDSLNLIAFPSGIRFPVTPVRAASPSWQMERENEMIVISYRLFCWRRRETRMTSDND